MTTAPPERLSDAELRKLATLLWRFAERDLDQFELWRFSVRAGQVFINMARQPDLGATPEAMTTSTALSIVMSDRTLSTADAPPEGADGDGDAAPS